jgi:hypothetical protein
MDAQAVNRICVKILIALSLTALLAVLSGYTGTVQPDEGAAAHIFQLSVVAFVLVVSLFLTTANWQQPLRNVRTLALPIATLSLSFGALYYLEHYWSLHIPLVRFPR